MRLTKRITVEDQSGDGWLDVDVDYAGLTIDDIRAEADRWKGIVGDRSLATAEDNASLQGAVEAFNASREVKEGFRPRNDYERAAEDVARAWEWAIDFALDAIMFRQQMIEHERERARQRNEAAQQSVPAIPELQYINVGSKKRFTRIAEKVGAPVATVKKWWAGKAVPTDEEMARIVAAAEAHAVT